MIPQEAAFPDPGQRSEPNPVAGRIEAAVRDSQTSAPALSSTPTVGDLLRALRRRWMTAVALGGTLAGISAVVVWYLMTPDYTAFAQIRVLSSPTSVAFQENPNNSQSSFMTYMRSQATQYKSRPVIQAALKRDDMKRLNLEANHNDPVLYIEDKLKIEIQDGSEFMTPKMAGTDPNEVTTIIKAMTAAYMGEIVYAEDRARRARHAQLENAFNLAVGNLNEKKAGLKNNAEAHGTTTNESLTFQQLQLLEHLREVKQDRNQARTELLKAQSMLDAHVLQLEAIKKAKLSDVQINVAVKADPKAAALETRLDRCKEVIQSYLDNARYPEQEPTYRAALKLKTDLEGQYAKRREEVKAELVARFDDQLKDDRDLAGSQLRVMIPKLEKQVASLDQDVEALTAKVEKFPSNITELDAQRADIRGQEKIVDALREQKEKLRVELDAPPRIIAPQDADLEKRDTKKQIAATVAAPIAVFFLVCTGLAWIEYRQRRIHTAGEVSHGLGIRVVGSIPNQANLERCLVGAAGETDLAGQPVLESIDAIRTLLLYQAQTASTRVVMVSSAAEGEGKTTLASHLAGSLARAGRKTLLIDADLRQPAVHQLFEVPLQPGFSEVLLGEVEVADSIQPTAIDSLSILPAGQWDREVIRSLARGGMEGIFEKLRQEFDFIIVDSHPVLSATDALLIGQHADAVLLSVLKQVSQMPRVYTACQRLTALNIRVLGAVVSGTDPDEVFTPPSYAAAVEQV